MPVVGKDKEATRKHLQKIRERREAIKRGIDEIRGKLWETRNIPLAKRPSFPFEAPVELLLTYPGLQRHHGNEYIESLKKSIEESGVVHKPVCTLDFSNFDAFKSSDGDSYGINALIPPADDKSGNNHFFYVVCGNARVQAIKELGRPYIDVTLKYLTPDEVFQLSLTENDDREEMNPIDRAVLFKNWMEKSSITQTEIARKRGKTQAWVAQTLRLLTLPAKVQQLIRQDKVSMNQANQILQISNPEAQTALAELCADGISQKELNAKIQETKLRTLNIDIKLPPETGHQKPTRMQPDGSLTHLKPMGPENPMKAARDGLKISFSKIPKGDQDEYKRYILMLFDTLLEKCTVSCVQCSKNLGCSEIIKLFSRDPFGIRLRDFTY